MDTFRIFTTVSKDGKLSIKGLPFRPGAKVEVTVRAEAQKSMAKRQALAGELKSLLKESNLYRKLKLSRKKRLRLTLLHIALPKPDESRY
jgi:hypothetical protein